MNLSPVNPELLQRSLRELQHKRGVICARLLTMQVAGLVDPRFEGFSLFQNWLQIPMRDKLRSLVGTTKCVFTRKCHQPMRYPWTR